jgi:transposase
LSDTQWAAIEPLLPRLGGKPRVDDRRVISGILNRFREGLRWRAIPAAYWPAHDPVQSVQSLEPPGRVAGAVRRIDGVRRSADLAMVDITVVRAHRSAAGAKGGSRIRQSADRVAGARPRSTRSQTARDASTVEVSTSPDR